MNPFVHVFYFLDLFGYRLFILRVRAIKTVRDFDTSVFVSIRLSEVDGGRVAG